MKAHSKENQTNRNTAGSNNTNPGVTKEKMDELAKTWVELVLHQILKAPVVFSKKSSNNIIIG